MAYFLAFALVPILIIGIINYFETRVSNVNYAFDTLKAQENISKVSIQDKINTIVGIGEKDAASVSIKNYVKTVNEAKQDDVSKNNIKTDFKNITNNFKYYANIALTDKNGVGIADAAGGLEN